MKCSKCSCGGIIVFDDTKTFTIPEEVNGVCIKCKTQFKKVDNKLIRKEKKNGRIDETKNG